MRFSGTFTHEIEEGVALPLRVEGVMTLVESCFEIGHPEEGGELEDIKIFSGCRLPKAIEDRLLASRSFLNELGRAL